MPDTETLSQPVALEILEENKSIRLKKSKFCVFTKFCLLVLLAIIPEIFFWSFKLDVIKMKAKDYLRCEIPVLENSSWNSEQIREITQTNGFHKECFIYKFDYSKVANMNFKDAKKFLEKNHWNRTDTVCEKFRMYQNYGEHSLLYQDQFANYCKSLKYDIVHDFLAAVCYIASCLFVLPLADISGRKIALSWGIHLAYLTAFFRVLSLESSRFIYSTLTLNAAYPLLKYTTQTIIFEIFKRNIRVFAFMPTFAGFCVPLIILGFIPPINWTLMELVALSSVLLFPLMNWFLPESPLWLLSVGRKKQAEFLAKNLDCEEKCNDFVFVLRRKRITFRVIKDHLKILKKIKLKRFISLFLMSFCVGILFFYPYSKHKFLYHFDEQKWTRIFNYLNSLFSVVCSIIIVSLLEIENSLKTLFFASGFTFIALCRFYSSGLYEKPMIILMNLIENLVFSLNILYQFYLTDISPATHRCTCLGIFNAVIYFGFFIINCIHLANATVARYMTTVACFIACAVMVVTSNFKSYRMFI